MNKEELKSIRKKSKLSQKEFSYLIGVTTRTLQNYESGKSEIPLYIEKAIMHEFISSNNNNKLIDLLKDSIKDKEEIIKAKDIIIKGKEKVISLLEDQLEELKKNGENIHLGNTNSKRQNRDTPPNN